MAGEGQAAHCRQERAAGETHPRTEKALSDRLAAIDGRLKAIEARFAKDFPEYASFTSSKPTSVAEVQALLWPDEALVLFPDTDERFKPTAEETFIG